MRRYGKGGTASGVVAYEAGDDFIRVKFSDGRVYRYTYHRPGWRDVEMMKLLAVRGKGLTTYINHFVRNRYEEKELY